MRALRPLLLAACLGLPGCGAGLIYTHIVVPLDVNPHVDASKAIVGRSDWKTFSFYVRVDWNSSALEDAARAGGITEIYFADMEILSVFFGLWEQRTAIVYGTGPGPADPLAPQPGG